MPKDIISQKTRNELREYFVGKYLREIEEEFDVVDIDCDYDYKPEKPGQRRCLVEQYYHSLNFSNQKDVRKFFDLYANVLINLEQTASSGSLLDNPDGCAKRDFANLCKWIQKDGFTYKDGRIFPQNLNVALEEAASPLQHIDSEHITTQLRRINESLDTDVNLAIGTAKELIESISKTILDERKIQYSNSDDIGKLIKKVRKVLRLLPEDIDEKVKGAKSIKTLLSNLGNIAQVMAELRNLYGTGHGKSGKSKNGLTQRHARLAVGAASTLVTFLYETHLERDS